MDEQISRLLLVRHGETAYNTGGRFRGRADPPLTTLGRMQARAVGSALAQLGGGALLISSPRARARKTLDGVAHRLGRAGAVDERFDDLDYGEWTGVEFSQAEERWPTEYGLWREAPDRLRLPRGERVSAARDRVWDACLDVARATQLVVVVTHDVCIRMATCALLQAPLASMHRLRADLASITEVIFQGPDMQLVRANDTSHLRHLGDESLSGEANA